MNDLYNVSEVRLTYERNKTNNKKMIVNSSAKIYALMRCNWEQIEYRETFKVMYLDAGNHVLGINTVALGGLANVGVDVRMILQGALLANAQGIACCHNHPSGDEKPSFNDDVITLQIWEACKAVNIELVDHLIITPYSYYSYADYDRLK